MSSQLSTYSGFEYENFCKKIKEKNAKTPKIIIDSLAQTQFFDDEQKLKFFIQTLNAKNYNASTAKKYLKQFKRLANINTNAIELNLLAFKPTQATYATIEELDTLLQHFVETQNLLMLFCFYTGLRSMEVAQFSSHHLYDLSQRKETTPLILKNGKKNWIIFYTPQLIDLIDVLTVHFKNELDYYIETKTHIPLWHLLPESISAKFKQEYFNVFKKKPPLGFGLHNIRYYWATKYAKNIMLAKLQLNHTKITTTKQYVKLNAEKIDFTKLNNTGFYNAIINN